jgi:putative membrane protein
MPLLPLVLADFPGVNGFLPGSRASLMLDVVVLAMFAVLPTLAVSIWLVRRGHYRLHKRIQLALGIVLLVAIAAFEVDMQLVSGWRERAMPSPYYGTLDRWGWVSYALCVHLLFALPTFLLWLVVIGGAVRNFPTPPRPSRHSPRHRLLGRLAAGGMLLTALTGWVFYWLAFVC